MAKSWSSLGTGGSCVFAYFKLNVIGSQLGHLEAEPRGLAVLRTPLSPLSAFCQACQLPGSQAHDFCPSVPHCVPYLSGLEFNQTRHQAQIFHCKALASEPLQCLKHNLWAHLCHLEQQPFSSRGSSRALSCKLPWVREVILLSSKQPSVNYFCFQMKAATFFSQNRDKFKLSMVCLVKSYNRGFYVP